MPDLKDATESVAPEKSSQETVADELEAAGKPAVEVEKETTEEALLYGDTTESRYVTDWKADE